MLIWQGLGAFAFVIPFVTVLVFQVLTQVVGGEAAMRQNVQVINGVALITSAVIVSVMGRRLAARPVRELVDKVTGQEVILRERHTMFFVPMKYWAWFWAVVGVGFVGSAIIVGLF